LEISSPENWVVKYIILLPKLHTYRYHISEDRSQKTEVRGQKSEDRSQRTEVRRQRTEDRSQKTEVRRQKTEVRGQNTEIRSRGWVYPCPSELMKRRFLLKNTSDI